jgi:hypothetical protein
MTDAQNDRKWKEKMVSRGKTEFKWELNTDFIVIRLAIDLTDFSTSYALSYNLIPLIGYN